MNHLVILMAIVASQFTSGTGQHYVATADTLIELQALDNEIRLSKLGGSSKTAFGAGSSREPTGIRLIDHAFLNGVRTPLKWTLVDIAGNRKTRELSFRFECLRPRLELTSTWTGDSGPGPVMHRLTIVNRDSRTVMLPRQGSLAFSLPLRPKLFNWWVEKSAGGPTSNGLHVDPLISGYRNTLLSTPYSEDDRRDPIPWCCLHDETRKTGVYLGIAFSGRVSIGLNADSKDRLSVDAGIADEPGFSTILKPRERFSAPPAFVGCFSGSVDDGANRLRQWLIRRLCRNQADPNYPLLTLNSWGSGMAIGEPLARSMIQKAADLGLEMFHIDAGWFRQVGDWRVNPEKFPNGLGPISDEIHRLGMKFGLWTGWTQAGIADEDDDRSKVLSAFSKTRGDWVAEPRLPNWKPEDFVGTPICLSVPAAQDWCLHLLDTVVTELNVDMLEHDQRMVVERCDQKDHSHSSSSSDIAYRSALGYYSVYDRLLKRHPKLMLEDCVNGGRMVDYGVLSRASYVSISDTYTPVENRQAFYDNSFAIPASMCECYVSDREPVHSIDEFIGMLRSGMMGWFTLMQNPASWTPEECTAAKRQFDIYKTKLRPLILKANLYHAAPRPDGKRWDGIQYAGYDKARAVLFAFRGADCPVRHVFALSGLDPAANYEVNFEDVKQKAVIKKGSDLMAHGIGIELEHPKTSALVFFSRTEGNSIHAKAK